MSPPDTDAKRLLDRFDARLTVYARKGKGFRELAAVIRPHRELGLSLALWRIETLLTTSKAHVGSSADFFGAVSRGDLENATSAFQVTSDALVDVLLSEEVQSALHAEGPRTAAVHAVKALTGISVRTIWRMGSGLRARAQSNRKKGQ